MSGDVADGAAFLGRAVGHAAFLYGDRIGDYDDILSAATRSRLQRSPADHTRLRARQLIAQAESGQLDTDPSSMSAWKWIGAATAVMEELVRHA